MGSEMCIRDSVTNFVVNNAGHGAEEIVDMLLANIEHPFKLSVSYSTPEASPEASESEDATKDATPNGKKDTSNLKLIALYLVSDAIQASSTSGVRDAWRYRALFETALAARGIFSHLGRLEKDFAWGRMKAEQWKRKVGIVLGLWEARSLFPTESQEGFKRAFAELSREQAAKEKEEEEGDERREQEEREKGRWRSAEEANKARAAEEAEIEAKRKRDEQARAAEKIREMKERAKAAQTQAQGSPVQGQDLSLIHI